MGAELSIPGFGWASLPVEKVKLSKDGFFFRDDSTNKKLLELLEPTLPSSIYDEVISKLKSGVSKADFDEVLSTQGQSRGRKLRFDVMHIMANLSFSLHAHPNVEAIYVIKGAIHEFRYLGEDLDKEVLLETKPRLAAKAEHFTRQQVDAGGWIVNTPGSVHLSFTRSEGADLLVLWSGSHLGLDGHHPALPDDVQPL
jgi:hypothetical protein